MTPGVIRGLALVLLVASACGSEPSAVTGYLASEPAIGYFELGTGPQTVIVLHGGPGATFDYLRPEWDRLAREQRLLFYDQRGCGRSGAAPSYHWRDHVADLDQLVRTLAPNQRVVLAGSSWGSHLALLYAHAHPERVRALVLSGVVPWRYGFLDPPPVGEAGGLHPERARTPAERERLYRLEESEAHRKRAEIEKMAKDLRAATRDMKAIEKRLTVCWEVYPVTIASFADLPPRESLAALAVPVLLVRGGRYDHLPDGAPALAEVLPHAVVRTIPDAGHDPWFSQPEEFFGLVGAFLSRLGREE